MSQFCSLKLSDHPGVKANYHTHTKRCFHAKGEDREYVEEAIKGGFKVLGFSDHAPFRFENGYVSNIRMKMEDFEEYVRSVEDLRDAYKDDITIHLGVEIEYFPNRFHQTVEELRQYPLEYMILGQHYFDDEVGRISVTKEWREEEQIRTYTDRVLTALSTDLFLYPAHIDILQFNGDPELWTKYYTRIIEEINRRDMPIEINYNGFHEKRYYPSQRLVDLAAKLGSKFILGVDAHKPEMLSELSEHEKCLEAAKKSGAEIINR